MKKIEAFATVEYALLLPVLYFLYAFLIYIGIYQYNACLQKNDAYFYAMKGEYLPYSNKYILAEEMEIDGLDLEMKNHSPQNIMRICKRLNNE